VTVSHCDFWLFSVIYSHFAPLSIRLSNQLAPNVGQVGIYCYQPNFWRLSISTRNSTE